MKEAVKEAKKAYAKNEVPVGAVIFDQYGRKLSAAHNKTIISGDASAHAEILAMRKAVKKLDNDINLNNCDMYVTLEPCLMCAQAISYFKVRRVYYGLDSTALYREKGAYHKASWLFGQHVPEVYGGFMCEEIRTIMKDFFLSIRQGG